MKSVLFVCTGNYYRSRYAEELFNFFAPTKCPDWRATSRGCALDLGAKNIGPIAIEAVEMLVAKRVTSFDRRGARMPRQLTAADLSGADHVVFLDEDEHRPLMQDRFAVWLRTVPREHVEWWNVHDVDKVASETALPIIDAEIDRLLQGLDASEGEPRS